MIHVLYIIRSDVDVYAFFNKISLYVVINCCKI